MSRTIKFLISNWPRCEYSASFYRQGSCFWPFSPWSRVGHALRPIFMFWLVKSWQVSSCGKFMQHLETWLLIAETDRVLCNIVNQWSVLAILLFAKNADNENKKCLKQSKSKKVDFTRPLSLFGIFGGMHSTDSCQKMAGNFGQSWH